LSRRTGLFVAVAVVVAGAFVVALIVASSDDEAADDLAADIEGCIRATNADSSAARTWNEALLEAVRLDFPSPTVHARNLFHSSAAMWDAWAAFDPVASGVFVVEKHDADDVRAAREEALSFAVYRVLVQRYLLSTQAEESITGFDQVMDDLCYDRSFTGAEGDSPAAFGNRIGATILAATIDDGSNESNGYAAVDYEPVNDPLRVADRGTSMNDPNRWQPLDLEVMVAQNGEPLAATVQTFVGPHWGAVTPFALDIPTDGSPALDPGPPPFLGEPASAEEFADAVVEVIAYSASLEPGSGEAVDIGAGAMGNAPLGTYDDQGHEVNPVTGEPYEANVVDLGDYGRAVAEYWADGPSSETPPGHWNTIANSVTDALDGDLRIGGEGQVVDALEWDVKLYLALNGAVHDGAIAAWGTKSFYDYVRPISMIRYMGGLGQSSDPSDPSHDPDGLPLEPGLIEIVTAESSELGERHERLVSGVGEVAVRSWLGSPDDPESEVGGVGWILATDWVPYQLSTFVTPAFASYVSGHSTFSRAGAEVLSAMTGSEFFPGGMGEWTIPADSLEFEAGPENDITLQWATYADAADEAGRSRLYGGIHVRADDLRGREMGFEAGRDAWALARQYFDGSIS
jgi:hypothetical protein